VKHDPERPERRRDPKVLRPAADLGRVRAAVATSLIALKISSNCAHGVSGVPQPPYYGEAVAHDSRAASVRWRACAALAALAVAASACARGPAVLRQQVEARQLAADLHVQFTKAAEAANRAVMADTDDASASAAREAEDATRAVQSDQDKLQPLVDALGYADEQRHLADFKQRFEEYRKIDAELLPLAVQNTNLKAQRLSFDAGRQAVGAVRAALSAAAGASAGGQKCCVDALVATAAAALLEIEVIQAQHIAESDDAAMSRMETQMTSLNRGAHQAIDDLRKALPSAGAALADAGTALARFESIHADIIKLSRLNSNVRSLALSLGRKRTVTAECDDALRELEAALAKHEFRATR
jgi:hypothetical protein